MTSRETRRWVIPKGWPIASRKPAEVAAQEAFEEAGLLGQIIGKRPVGVFHYAKRLEAAELLCEVRVYLFWVDRQVDEWPEMGQRDLCWFSPDEAASRVNEGGLAEIIRLVLGARVMPTDHRLSA